MLNKKGQAEMILPLVVVVFFIAAIVSVMGFDYVPAGYVGVKDRLGVVEPAPWGPGVAWTGVLTSTKDFSIKIQLKEFNANAASKDLQMVKTQVALNFRVNPASTPDIYKNIGRNYQDIIIAPTVQEAVKSSTAKYNAEELINNRAAVKADITNFITARLEGKGLIVTEVAITNFQFSEEFDKAVEAKQISDQQAQQAENKFKEMEWNSRAMELQKEVLEIKKLDLQQNWIDKWSGNLPQTLIINGDGEAGNFLLNLPSNGAA